VRHRPAGTVYAIDSTTIQLVANCTQISVACKSAVLTTKAVTSR
jgi:hypothetical protein